MSERELSYRPTHRGEAETLARLVNVAYGRTSEEAGWTSEGHLIQGPRVEAEEIREMIDEPRSTILVAEQGEGPTACVHLSRREDDACKLGLLAVRAEEQGKGVGAGLLQAAEDYAREEMGADRMVLSVLSAREELFPWYRKQGYVSTGERRSLELGEDQRSRVGPLELEVLVKQLE